MCVRRRGPLVALVVAAALLELACGGGDPLPAASGGRATAEPAGSHRATATASVGVWVSAAPTSSDGIAVRLDDLVRLGEALGLTCVVGDTTLGCDAVTSSGYRNLGAWHRDGGEVWEFVLIAVGDEADARRFVAAALTEVLGVERSATVMAWVDAATGPEQVTRTIGPYSVRYVPPLSAMGLWVTVDP